MNKTYSPSPRGFTLLELLTVIAVITILMALLFPALRTGQVTAKKTKARHEIMQIVNAIRSYQTEYGKLPVKTTAASDADDFFAGINDQSKELFDVLTSEPGGQALNPRGIVFLDAPPAKTPPRDGIAANGRFYDPFGNEYRVRFDNSYNNRLENPYSANAGPAVLKSSVIVWSLGPDGEGAQNATGGGDKATGVCQDDLISWQ